MPSYIGSMFCVSLYVAWLGCKTVSACKIIISGDQAICIPDNQQTYLMSNDTAGHLFALDYISTSKWHEYCNLDSDFITYKFDERRYCMFIGNNILQKLHSKARINGIITFLGSTSYFPSRCYRLYWIIFSSVVVFRIMLMLNNIKYWIFSCKISFPDYNNALWLFYSCRPVWLSIYPCCTAADLSDCLFIPVVQLPTCLIVYLSLLYSCRPVWLSIYPFCIAAALSELRDVLGAPVRGAAMDEQWGHGVTPPQSRGPWPPLCPVWPQGLHHHRRKIQGQFPVSRKRT